LLQLVEHVVERQLLARGRECGLPILREFTPILCADVEREVLTRQRDLHGILDIGLLARALPVDAVADVRDRSRKIQRLRIAANFLMRL
jgi:hypothetical protein